MSTKKAWAPDSPEFLFAEEISARVETLNKNYTRTVEALEVSAAESDRLTDEMIRIEKLRDSYSKLLNELWGN